MSDEKARPKQTNYGVCAFWGLMVLLLIIAGLVFAIVYLTLINENIAKDVNDDDGGDDVVPSAIPDSGACDSLQCITLAAALIDKMDSTVDPCKDFYDYACGDWLQNTILSSGQKEARTLDRSKRRQLDLKVILEAPETPDELDAVKKVKTVYKACTDKASREANGLTAALGRAEIFGGWPVLENNPGGFFDSAAFNLTTLATSLFVGARSISIIDANVKNKGNQSFQLEISAGTLSGLPSEEYLTDIKYSKEREAYLKYMTDVVLAFGAHPDVAGPEMAAVLNLETQLAQAKLESTPTPGQVMTVGEMKAMYPEFSWDIFLQSLIPSTTVTVTDDFELVNADAEYLSKAFAILSSEPPRLVADWMLWLFFNDAMTFFNDDLRNIYYEFQSSVNGISTPEYYEDCLDFVNDRLRSVAGRLYADNYFTPDDWSKIRELAFDVKMTLERLVETDEPFKDEMTIEALQNLEIAVGIPPFLFDDEKLNEEYADLSLPAEGSDSFQNWLAILFFRQKQNMELLYEYSPTSERHQASAQFFGKSSIHITPSDARPPAYDDSWPTLLNYASLGMLTARDMIAEIQPAENIKDTTSSCLQQQYGDIMLSNMNEVIADNAGIQVAGEVLKLKLLEGHDVSLPGLRNTAGQLFFLQNAQLWCEKYNPEYEMHLESDITAKQRVNTMLQNSEAFAEAFSCPVGTEMNPEDKCVVL